MTYTIQPHYVTVTVSNAELKALRATPKTLVPAPGAGWLVLFLGAVVLLDAGANALTEATANLAIRYKDGTGVQVSETVEATGFLDQTADTLTTCRVKQDAIAAKSACENQPLVLHNLGAAEYGGNAANDATLRVKVLYHLTQTQW